jgi:hypothetical protein
MSVHFKKTCYRTPNVVCHAPSETKWNKTQPQLVIQGWTKEIIIKDDKIIIT